MDSGYSVYEQLVISAKKRRDIWPSREVAYDWFANRWPWKFWDKRELNLYVKYGLHDLPTRTYPDRTDGVTLACTRIQEASGYIYYQDGIDSLDRLSELCSIIPVHCILGDRVEVVSDDIREATVDPAQGRKMASIITIDDSGHAAVQEHPEVVGDAVWKILISITSTNRASRL
ncbi:hypothetical protein EUX98_g2571 [Antrodiella citrinella]|uniref:AB hydrolase-1 domain-containing protein n=1 Tax=Antrodiella citrinella TaxID=2447956 RepID=A0A4S4N1L3_9APHY|nr:hypothetical protein EUX98_g2571 [Antrodiella citrinella]